MKSRTIRMPYQSLRQCTYPGCCTLVKSGRCAKHTTRVRRNPGIVRLYNSSEWQVLRSAQLVKEPWCADCLYNNAKQLATDVDHIRAHRGDPKLFFDEQNLQSLCKRHHSVKTAREVWHK